MFHSCSDLSTKQYSNNQEVDGEIDKVGKQARFG